MVDVPQEKPPLLSGSDAQALQFLKVFADEVHMADNVVKNPPSHLVMGSITKQNDLQHYANIFEPGRGKPLRNVAASTVIRAMKRNFARHGIPATPASVTMAHNSTVMSSHGLRATMDLPWSSPHLITAVATGKQSRQ